MKRKTGILRSLLPFFILASLPNLTAAAPINLENALNKSRTDNFDQVSKQSEIRKRKLQSQSAKLRSNPSLLIDSQLMPFSGNWKQNSAGGPTQRDVVLTFPVDIMSTKSLKAEMYSAQSQALESQKEMESTDIEFKVRMAYYKTLASLKKRKILDQHNASLRKILDSVRSRVRDPSRQPLLLSRLELFLAQSEFQSDQLLIDYENSRFEFCSLIGDDTHCEPDINHDFFEIYNSSESGQPAKGGLFKKYVEAQQESLLKELSFLNRSFFDGFNIILGASRQEQLSASPAGAAALPSANSWLVGLNAPLPVFNVNQKEKDAVRISIEQFDILKHYNSNVIEGQIELTEHQIKILTQKSEKLDRHLLPIAKKVAQLAKSSFANGLITPVDFFDASRTYIDTEFLHIDTLVELLQARFELQRLRSL